MAKDLLPGTVVPPKEKIDSPALINHILETQREDRMRELTRAMKRSYNNGKRDGYRKGVGDVLIWVVAAIGIFTYVFAISE